MIDFPGMVNQKIMNAELNTAVANFDSQSGLKSYIKTIYQVLAVVVLLTMEVAIIAGALDCISDDKCSAMSKIGSIVTSLLLLYSAFPIAHIIRSRGEALGDSKSAIVGFWFKDFVIANIRILGEVAAVSAFVAATCVGLSFLFDASLYNASTTSNLLGGSGLASLTSLPMEALNNLLSALKLDYLSDFLANITAMRFGSEPNGLLGDMKWYRNDLLMVAGGFINVMIGLAIMYVNIAIYNFLYGMVETFSKWIQNPSLPISTKNRS